MSESRDSNDPRDAMRAMRKEAREELERAEAEQTGGQEHASRDDRAGVPEARRDPALEADTEELDEVTREQSDADVLRVPKGDPVAGGGGDAAGGPPSTAPGSGRDQS